MRRRRPLSKREKRKYIPSYLSPSDRKAQHASIMEGTDRPTLESATSRSSRWVTEFKRRFGRPVSDYAFVNKYLLRRPGIEKVLDRGRGAYRHGSRPNQTAESWARARLASVLVNGPARTSDRDIWDQYSIASSAKTNQPFVNTTAKNKKYSVYVQRDGKRRLIHFGDINYEHYRDVIGAYAHRDHRDKARRQNYYRRHGPEHRRSSPRYWSHRILWPKT